MFDKNLVLGGNTLNQPLLAPVDPLSPIAPLSPGGPFINDNKIMLLIITL